MCADLSAIQAVFEPLLHEYAKMDAPEKTAACLAKIENCFETWFADRSAGETIHWLEKLKAYYSKAQLDYKVKEINVRLVSLGPRLISEMKVIRGENTFSKDTIDHFTELVLSQPPENIFTTLATTFLFDSEKQKNFSNKPEVHISDLVKKEMYSASGIKVATIGSVEDDEKGRAIEALMVQMAISAVTLHLTLATAKERNIIKKENFMNFITRSPVIAPERYVIFDRAFDAWYSRDFLVFLHLAIPQIEAACLQIAKNAGEDILKENKYGGYNVILFGDLLRKKSLQNVLGINGADYFLALFADPRGYNLRNAVAHGLLNNDAFDENFANFTFIAVLHLICCTTNSTACL